MIELKIILSFSWIFSVAQTGTMPKSDQETRLYEDVETLMRSNHISGGIVEYSACNASSVHVDFKSNDIESALNALTPSTQVHWKKIAANNTYLVEIGQRPSEILINTVLPALVVTGDTLNEQSGYLLNYPNIQSKSKRLGIKVYDRGFGFSSTASATRLPTLKVPEGTLGEDLNRIAAQQPGSVWLLSQNSCDNRTTDSFSWISR